MSGVDDDELRQQVLGAFGLKPWDIGGPVPWRVRAWRRVTFAYRRGRPVDWRGYEAAEAQAQQREQEFRADLGLRAADAAHLMSGLLPDGLRFEVSEDE